MCAIAGLRIPNPSRDLLACVTSMTDRLRHRGPDGAGVWIDRSNLVGLGHRRLAVVDPSPRSNQPMHSICGRYVVVFNGEIYNHKKLAANLSERGHSFRTTSDTEVLVETIAALGLRQAVEVIEGMFAFAVWDEELRKLSVCRDRFGIKPCYWFWRNGTFVFASELKALIENPLCWCELDPVSIRHLLDYGYVASPRTAFANVHHLEPGTILNLCDDSSPSLERYWDGATARAGSQDRHAGRAREDLIDHAAAIVTDTIQQYINADVPVGTFLSGGVDSSIITAIAARQTSGKISTFSVGFTEEHWNEAHRAQAIAAHLGTKHHTVHISPNDALALVEMLPDVYDEPFADFSQLPTLALCRFAREHVTVCLSGDGGDELFGGYSRYAWAAQVWRSLASLPESERRARLSELQRGTISSPLRMLLPEAILCELAKVLPLGTPTHKFPAFYHRVMRSGAPSVFCPFGSPSSDHDDWPAPSDASLLDSMQAYDLRRYMGDGVLTKVDRASMSTALEVRIPFLAEPVVEFAFGLSQEHRQLGSALRPLQRALALRYVPEKLLDPGKMGFGFPVDSWLRTCLRTWADDLLSPVFLRSIPYLQHRLVERLWSEHRSGKVNHHWQLWPVLMYVQWHWRWRGCVGRAQSQECLVDAETAKIFGDGQ
nr:asparagine synthase (glutamine-hydrolyzing) [Rhizobium sp. FKY42]